MLLPPDILNFIDNQSDLSIGYNEINFFKSHNIEESQIGYSKDLSGQSLVGEADGDWRNGWLVIATDQSGDPIFLDVKSPGLVVYTAAHGEGNWEPEIIADTLSGFKPIMDRLQTLSVNRSNPIEIDQHPMMDAEKHNFLTYVEQANPNSKQWYWEQFIE
jgi:hypothetical protein